MNSTASILRTMGFKVVEWEMPLERIPHADDYTIVAIRLQITDSNGITFYMPENATVQQCMDRYREKLEQFQTTKG